MLLRTNPGVTSCQFWQYHCGVSSHTLDLTKAGDMPEPGEVREESSPVLTEIQYEKVVCLVVYPVAVCCW
jgi:hypothetical protein